MQLKPCVSNETDTDPLRKLDIFWGGILVSQKVNIKRLYTSEFK